MAAPYATVKYRAVDHKGMTGKATYVGKTVDGEDVYRLIFGKPGHEHSAKFRASDLFFRRPS